MTKTEILNLTFNIQYMYIISNRHNTEQHRLINRTV